MDSSDPPSVSDLRTRLSEALGVSDEPQDWGIVNADGERLEEFAAYLRGHQLTPTQLFDLVDLLFASANERLVRNPSADVSVLGEVLRSQPTAAAVHCGYWTALDDLLDFPLGAWLRQQDLSQ